MIGILGGTFDPVHFGHLRPALELLEQIPLSELRFVPCRVPAHREAPVLCADARCELLRLAIAGQPGFVIDERELHRDGPSYMVDTLATLRAEIGPTMPLALIVGCDAFLGLPQWHRWERIPELAHVIVMQRPGHAASPRDPQWYRERLVHEGRDLTSTPAGRVLFWSVTQLEISATQIRAEAAAGRSLRYLVPAPVADTIAERGWYRHAP